MIVPWLRGLLNFAQAPLTWTLCGVNVLIFLMTLEPSRYRDENVYRQENLETMGMLYKQYLGTAQVPPKQEVYLLGIRALRDKKFLDNFSQMQFVGDQIAISALKKNVDEFREKSGSQTIKLFGLTDWDNGHISMLTYQFMHAGWIHLISNALLLLIFAGALERITNSALVVGVYLLGGFGGAFSFLWWVKSTTAPMVGASASLSAIMACYAILEKKKRVPFFYFFSPFEGHFGWLHLPTWLILPIGFAGDIGSILSTNANFSPNIAYSAHLGGALTGVVIALVIRFIRSGQSLGASYSRS